MKKLNKKILLKEDITSAASPSYLPQLNQPFTNIVDGLKDENVEWKPVIVRVGQLKPLQKNVTVDKMKSISSDMLDNGKEMDPIFISNDDYILDGHHRAAGLINAKGRDEKIKCIRIDLDKDNGVRMLNKVSDKMEFEEQHKEKDKPQVENKNVLRFNKKQLEEYAKQVINNNLEEYDLNEDDDKGYIKKSYFIDPHPDRISKAENYGLMDIENEDLTPEGLIAKMIEWDEGEHGVEAYVYDMTEKQLEKQGYKMPDEIRRISDDVSPIKSAFHGGYHTTFPGYSLNENNEDDFWKFFNATEIDSIEFEGVVYVDGKNKVLVRAYDGKKIRPTKQQIRALEKESFKEEGGYEGLAGDDERVKDLMGENELSPYSIKRKTAHHNVSPIRSAFHGGYHSDLPGYRLNEDELDNEEEIRNEIKKLNEKYKQLSREFKTASGEGSSRNIHLAMSETYDKIKKLKDKLNKISEGENELEEGPRTHSELRRQKIKSYGEKHYGKSRMRPYEREKYAGSYDISENNENRKYVVLALNKRTDEKEILNKPSTKEEADKFKSDFETIGMGKYSDFEVVPDTFYRAGMEGHPAFKEKYSLNEKEISEDEDKKHINWVRSLPKEYYSPSDSNEYFDKKTNTFFNRNGDNLRNPSEYDSDSEGYTPFGDEGISEDKVNEYIKLKEKYNVKNLPSEELSLEEQNKFMEELNKSSNNKRKVRLNEKQFTEMITNIKKEYALSSVPIAGEASSL